MLRTFAQFFAVLLFAALTCAVGWGQAASTAQISGTVKDQTGALLPGVEVSATQTDTGLKRTALTDETGSYTLQNLPIGPYRLEVALTGFSTYVQSGIVLQVNSNPQINPVLQVGQVTEQIEVQANASLVETRSTGIGQIIDNQRVLELPLNGRQPTELILLSGMAVSSNAYSGTLATVNRNYPTVAISLAGGMLNGMTYLLDGGTHNDPFNNLNLPMPFPDALQEFKVETSALPAQYGHHSSAAINAVTKSGTNEFHGGLFEFLRNGSLNARNTFALRRDTLKRNQFGGTLGGPIKENRLFFFGGFQGTTLRSAPTTQQAYVPTPAMLAGDFTTIASPACNTAGRAITLGTPFAGNRISPSLFAAEALKLVPILPTTSDPCGLVRFGRSDSQNEQIMLGRMDYQWTNKHSLFGRYQLARLSKPDDYDGQNVLSLANGPLRHRVHSFVLGDTYLIGAETISSFRATLNRTNIARLAADHSNFLSITDLGMQVYDPIPRTGSINVTPNGFNYLGGGGNNAPGHYNTTTFQFAEDISLVRGRHQIGLGSNYINQKLNSLQNVFVVPRATFSGEVTGLGLADFLIGKMSQYGGGGQHTTWNRTNFIALYLQDSWKATSRFTVNAGVRWEPYLPQYSKRNKSTHFDPVLFAQGVRSTIYKKAPAGVLFPGDPGMPEHAVGFPRWLDFAPRIGFAWDPRGNGGTSIRAAYGIFYDYGHLYNYLAFSQGPPFGPILNVPFPTSMRNPWQDYPGGNPFPINVTPDSTFPIAGAFLTLPLHPKHPYMNQWNLSVQHALGSDLMVSANYVGNNTIHMQSQNQLNPAVYIPGSSTLTNTDQRRILYLQNRQEGQYYASISEQDEGGTTNYEALVLSIQNRGSKGLTVQSNYTWSHCIGDLYSSAPASPGTNNYTIPGNRRLDRASCITDVRHVFNLSTVYQTPQFSNNMLRKLASDWQLSGITRLQSGGVLTVTTGVDSALTGQTLQRANQVLADPYAANKSVSLWINPAAFTQPATGTYSSLGRNTLRGPGLIRIDVGVTRTFKVREKQSIQFRAEAFNLPNLVNLGDPVTARNNQNFGRILTAGDPRIMQLALKYVF